MIIVHDDQNLLDWFDQQGGRPTGIIHQCNAFHTMGAGIARQIRMRYPEAYLADCQTPKAAREKVGTFSIALVKDSQTRFVYNLYSQFNYGTHERQTSYDAMVDGLEKIVVDAEKRGIQQIGVPYNMGCKLGGGSWRIVESILKEAFDENWTDINLVICRYEP